MLDPENLYAAGNSSKPYLTLPAWIRRFLFQVLKPRELSVYIYLLSLMNQNGIAFPLTRQIADDLGIRDREVVAEAVGRLEDLGFILLQKRTVQLTKAVVRNVYQRPTLEHTLITLLHQELIDGDLYPTRIKANKADAKTADEAILLGLRTLTNNTADVDIWSEANPEDKSDLLAAMLARSLQRRRRFANHL